MIRRLNGTGRQQIGRAHAAVSLRPAESGEPPVFDLQLDLASYRFPPDARVRVEAWRSNTVQRWDFGAAGAPAPPTEADRRMTEVPEASKFRVLVVAGDGSGRLLGHAPSITPTLPQRSLLAVREADDDELGGEVWRVDFGDGDLPQLLVNSAVGGISEVVRSDRGFRALVMPAVLRAVLIHALVHERADPDDGDGDWDGWFRLAVGLLPDTEIPRLPPDAASTDLGAAMHWIDAVVRAFTLERMNAASLYEPST